jgi:hypothetical protein
MCHCGEEEKAKGLCSRHYLADYRIRKSQGLIKKTETILLKLRKILEDIKLKMLE